jgi:hypothetical protein
MPTHQYPTFSTGNRANIFQESYSTLSPKGRAILSILVADYERNGDEGLTRRQIAEQLGQLRLYPHDDRAIKRLQDEGFIYISEQQLGDLGATEYGYYSPRRNNVNRYTVFHVHWLSQFCYSSVVELLKADGLYQERDWGVVGDVANSVQSAWGWLRSKLLTK